ncbi:MAG: hypothetical protein K2X44_12670 [Magnetospirillum sp.]|nr:hypothetical protein [Magnetospirillum sp.]
MVEDSWRYFVTYSGVKLPLRLVNPLAEDDLGHRNTFFRARFDSQDRMLSCDKMVYGDVQMSHRYEYGANGIIARAEIVMGDEVTVMEFDESGLPRR